MGARNKNIVASVSQYDVQLIHFGNGNQFVAFVEDRKSKFKKLLPLFVLPSMKNIYKFIELIAAFPSEY